MGDRHDVCGDHRRERPGLGRLARAEHGHRILLGPRRTKTRAFANRFFAVHQAMPTMFQAGVYSAVTQYLKAVQATGSTDADTIRAYMLKTPMVDVFLRHGKLLPNGRMLHDMLLGQIKAPAESHEPWGIITASPASFPARTHSANSRSANASCRNKALNRLGKDGTAMDQRQAAFWHPSAETIARAQVSRLGGRDGARRLRRGCGRFRSNIRTAIGST